MRSHLSWLAFIIVISAAALWITLPDTSKPDFLKRGGDEEALADCLQRQLAGETGLDCEQYEPNLEFNQGLDLVGGLRILLAAELPEDAFSGDDLREAANNVSRRVNAFGLSEATVQVQGRSRILVELPGLNADQESQAIDTIQQTALLEFVDFGGLNSDQVNALTGQQILTTQQALIEQQRLALAAEQTPEAGAEATAEATSEPLPVEPQRQGNPLDNGQPFDTVLTGDMLQAATAQYDANSGRWLIVFELTSEGASIFGNFTASRVNEPLAIVLDGEVLSAPIIQQRLDSGGTITGNFTEDEAKTLALQLRSGSLPIPLRVESAETVGATLGKESVDLSVRAGVVGIIVVLVFMLVYYRVPGIAADLALLVFVILNMAAFKLIPVTLTLPAITGFLISIGTAVDGNILIFERVKEELRGNKGLDEALESGFNRAWVAIRDSNFSTIIICGVLFLFGQTPGASVVSGFAVTLALGLVLNLFTAVIATRTFLYLLVHLFRKPVQSRKWLLGV